MNTFLHMGLLCVLPKRSLNAYEITLITTNSVEPWCLIMGVLSYDFLTALSSHLTHWNSILLWIWSSCNLNLIFLGVEHSQMEQHNSMILCSSSLCSFIFFMIIEEYQNDECTMYLMMMISISVSL